MGFWGTLGKLAVNAAPYVAAPFTGGASLMAAPMANKLGQRIGSNNTMIDKIGGVAGNIAGGFGTNAMAGKIGGGMGTPGINGGPSGQVPNLGNRTGLPPWVMNMTGGQGNNPMQSTMGSNGSGVSGFIQSMMGGGQGNQSPTGGIMEKLSGFLGGNRGQEPVSRGYGTGPLNNEAYQQQGGQRQSGIGPSMGFGRGFDSYSPDLSVPLMAGKQQGRNYLNSYTPPPQSGQPDMKMPDINSGGILPRDLMNQGGVSGMPIGPRPRFLEGMM
jgi:hypothetical protein